MLIDEFKISSIVYHVRYRKIFYNVLHVNYVKSCRCSVVYLYDFKNKNIEKLIVSKSTKYWKKVC